jgi:glycosyltransferase involved in cell wall biosynthesis
MPPGSPRPLVLLITGLAPGGAERALTQLAIRLDRQQFVPTVVSLQPRPEGERSELVELLEQHGVPVKFLNARSKLQFPTAVWRLSRLLRSLRPAVIQSFLFHANVVAALAGRMCSVPVVAGVRVADPSRVRQRVERWIAPWVEQFVCVSQSVADFCKHTCRLPAEKLTVIPNGVDVPRFRDASPADLASLSLTTDRRYLISIGRLDRQKGYDWLLPELPAIFAACPEYDLLLVGEGPERTALRAQAAALGIEGRVHFLGWRPDVPQLLKLADLLLLPSRWEGMPNVLLEAMAAGLPVVTTRVEGAEEILGPLGEHQLVPLGDGAAFRERVLAFAKSAELRQLTGIANQSRMEAHFSLAMLATVYESLYRRVINS